MVTSNGSPSFLVLTPEYPPDKSGIAGFAQACSEGLAERGYGVRTWTRSPRLLLPTQIERSHACHKLSSWSETELEQIQPRKSEITILMFDPYRFGPLTKTGLLAWLQTLHAQDFRVWLIMHRFVGATRERRTPLTWWRQWRTTRYVRQMLPTFEKVFVATTSWNTTLFKWGCQPEQLEWLPVPAYTAIFSDQQRVQNLRKAFAHDSPVVIGTFGSYLDSSLCRALQQIIPKLLRGHPDRHWLALGRGSDQFVQKTRQSHPDISTQLACSDEITKEALSVHIQTCDLMLQPYARGIDSSRTSTMLALAHGKPTVTTQGWRTEAIWSDSRCVRLAPAGESAAIVRAVEHLLSDPHAAADLSSRAQHTYDELFSVRRCIDHLEHIRKNSRR